MDEYASRDIKYYLYYRVKALCVKAWFNYAPPHRIYEFEKQYYYQSHEDGYVVNSYKIRIINSAGTAYYTTLKPSEFDKYFTELPGTLVKVC